MAPVTKSKPSRAGEERAEPSVALVLDHAAETDGARARLADIVGWLFAHGVRHVTIVGAGDIDPASLPRTDPGTSLRLLATQTGRASVVAAVASCLRSGTAITHQSLDAEAEHFSGPSPDLILLIGEHARLDDAFTWTAAYSELCLLPAPWEKLTEAEVARAVEDFARRDRRFGALGPASP